MERFMGRNKELVKYRDNHLILDCFTAFAMTEMGKTFGGGMTKQYRYWIASLRSQ